MRHTAQKAMVNIDTGRRYAAALLRHSRNVEKNYTVGDLIMYKTKRSDVVNEEKSSTRVSDWNGPARITGFDKDVVWLQHAAVPVASAVHLLRPATASECLAAQVLSRNSTPLEMTPMDSNAGQQSFIESRPDKLEKSQLAVPAARVPDPPFPAGFAEVELDSVSDQDQDQEQEAAEGARVGLARRSEEQTIGWPQASASSGDQVGRRDPNVSSARIVQF